VNPATTYIVYCFLLGPSRPLKRRNRGVVSSLYRFEKLFDGAGLDKIVVSVALIEAANGLGVGRESPEIALANSVHEPIQRGRIESLQVNLGHVVIEGHGVAPSWLSTRGDRKNNRKHVKVIGKTSIRDQALGGLIRYSGCSGRQPRGGLPLPGSAKPFTELYPELSQYVTVRRSFAALEF